MKKVIIFSQSVHGYQNHTRHECLLEASKHTDLDVFVVTAPDKPSLVPSWVRKERHTTITSVGVFPWRLRRGGLDIFDIFFRIILVFLIRPDVVHCDGHRPATLIPSFCGKFLGAKLVAEWVDLFSIEGIGSIRKGFFSGLIQKIDQSLEEYVKKKADHVIAISAFLYERAETVLSIPINKLSIVRGGCFSELAQTKDFSKSNNPKQDKQHFQFGFLGYEKADYNDLLVCLQAVQIFRDKGFDVKLVVTGLEIKRIFSEISSVYGAAIDIKGWLSFQDYKRLLQDIDCFLVPMSKSPRNCAKWPMKLGDYLSAGKPILASNVGEISWVHSKYECLKVFENEEELSEGLDSILMNVELREELGRKAREVATGDLSWAAQSEIMTAVYTELLSQ
jgi:glycosyltransferase involved in cell wall biosynthesis